MVRNLDPNPVFILQKLGCLKKKEFNVYIFKVNLTLKLKWIFLVFRKPDFVAEERVHPFETNPFLYLISHRFWEENLTICRITFSALPSDAN